MSQDPDARRIALEHAVALYDSDFDDADDILKRANEFAEWLETGKMPEAKAE